ncbi:unnamed protein product [Paramecium pentaurelia]|uniref:Uncharacterized protein n=1 Tax=Paramecium pentaurelia TaxID=43138 RepID=A0A8S1S6B9_9CILI|nr:unnamed protein product [Paramecium pentaurelia]
MNKVKEHIENNFNYQDMIEEEVEMNEQYLYEDMSFTQKPIENKNFTLSNILNQLNIDDHNNLQIEECHY